MVHKRYIKKNGKLIGPYYYESYREDGKVKKRYLGTVHPDELAKQEDIESVKQGSSFKLPEFNLKNIVWGISILLVILIAITLFLSFQGVQSLLGLNTEPVYQLGDNLYGSAIVTLEFGDYIPAGTILDLTIFKGGVAVYKKSQSATEFFSGKIESRNISDVRTVCDESSGGFCHNETIFLGEVFNTPGVYSVSLSDFLNYRLEDSGNYEILFSISSLNLFVTKSFMVSVGPNGETTLKHRSGYGKGNTTFNGSISNDNRTYVNVTISNQSSITGNGSNIYCPGCSNISSSVNTQGQQCEYSDCYQGSKTKTCIDSFGSAVRESIPCVSDCSSDFVCDSWKECESGISYRSCVDSNGCSADIKESRECFSQSCKSNIICSDWSSCSYNTKTEDIINGVISRFGKQQRLCSDLNGCISSYVEQRDCNLSIEISIVKEKDPCNPQNYIIKAFKRGTTEPVMDVNIQRWTESGQLNINFVENETKYCSSCYNGIFDDNEDGLDCGGICKPCGQNKSSFNLSSKFSVGLLIGLISILFVVFIFILISILGEKDHLREIRKLIASGRTYLAVNDKQNARDIYRNIQEKYSLLNPEMQKEIKSDILSFHSDLIGFKIPD
jgi:hypothetical protein